MKGLRSRKNVNVSYDTIRYKNRYNRSLIYAYIE